MNKNKNNYLKYRLMKKIFRHKNKKIKKKKAI